MSNSDSTGRFYKYIGSAGVEMFILGTGLGKSIKDGRQMPHAAAAILIAAGIPMHRSSRYFAMVALAIILAPVLSRLTGILGGIKR